MPPISLRRQGVRQRLARALQRERARKRWTQERAAEAAGLYPRHYQRLEKGSVNVTIGKLERLCRGFGISSQSAVGAVATDLLRMS